MQSGIGSHLPKGYDYGELFGERCIRQLSQLFVHGDDQRYATAIDHMPG